MSDPTNLPATVPTDPAGAPMVAANTPQALSSLLGSGAVFWSSIVLDSHEQRQKLFEALHGQNDSFEASLGEPLAITDVVLAERDRQDPATGELQRWVRIVILCDDGKILAGGSAGVRQSLGTLFGLYGNPPWKPPVVVKIKSRPIDGGKRFFYLELVKISDPARAKKDANAQPAKGGGKATPVNERPHA